MWFQEISIPSPWKGQFAIWPPSPQDFPKLATKVYPIPSGISKIFPHRLEILLSSYTTLLGILISSTHYLLLLRLGLVIITVVLNINLSSAHFSDKGGRKPHHSHSDWPGTIYRVLCAVIHSIWDKKWGQICPQW